MPTLAPIHHFPAPNQTTPHDWAGDKVPIIDRLTSDGERRDDFENEDYGVAGKRARIERDLPEHLP
jgi:hypothetical protein